MHTRTVRLASTSDQAQANDFLWLGNKQRTCHTHHTSNGHTHRHTFNIWILCVCKLGMHVCLFPVRAQSDLSLSPDQTLVCSWHGLLGYDTSRETQRTQ